MLYPLDHTLSASLGTSRLAACPICVALARRALLAHVQTLPCDPMGDLQESLQKTVKVVVIIDPVVEGNQGVIWEFRCDPGQTTA
jgi:hypothetical protein